MSKFQISNYIRVSLCCTAFYFVTNHIITIFAFKLKKSRMTENINRIKVVLCEKNVKAKWLAEQLKVNPTTVSKWCTNTSQPDLYTLRSIASLLGVDVRRLLNSTEDMSIAAEPVIIYGVKNG